MAVIKDWNNLKTLNCPLCFGDLESHPTINTLLKCSGEGCPFMIGKDKIREVVGGMFAKAGDDFGRADFEELMKNP